MSNRNWIVGALAALGIAGLANAQTISQVVNTVAVGGITGLGTSVATALGINVGSAGAILVKGTSVCADLSNGATGCSTTVGTIATQNYTASTWTPNITGTSTAGTGQTYSAQVGSYEQIGRQVTVRFLLQATSLGTAAGNIQISGLPVAAANVSNDFGICSVGFYSVTGLAALNYGIGGYIINNTSIISLNSFASTGGASITVTQAGSTVNLFGMCSYRAS